MEDLKEKIVKKNLIKLVLLLIFWGVFHYLLNDMGYLDKPLSFFIIATYFILPIAFLLAISQEINDIDSK